MEPSVSAYTVIIVYIRNEHFCKFGSNTKGIKSPCITSDESRRPFTCVYESRRNLRILIKWYAHGHANFSTHCYFLWYSFLFSYNAVHCIKQLLVKLGEIYTLPFKGNNSIEIRPMWPSFYRHKKYNDNTIYITI